MKKILLIIYITLLSVFLIGCDFIDNDEPKGGLVTITPTQIYKVEYIIDGELKFYMNVYSIQGFDAPEIPEKENYITVGWVNSDGELHDFSKPVNKDTTLYAKYEADYRALTNIISTKIMSSNVKIEVQVYNLGGWFNTEKRNVLAWQGSGIIFFDAHGYYYLLTNEHVTNMQGRKYVTYTIIDYKGNRYTAAKGNNYEQSSYDLSVLYFKKTTQVLNVIEISRKNPIKNQEIVAIGQPDGQNNTITFGKITQYTKVTLSNGFSPTFDVITHNAPVAPGSSGGALLDLNLNLIGINFARRSDSSGEFIYGYSIPAETIRTYLNAYVLVG